jgi:hypothetical protein
LLGVWGLSEFREANPLSSLCLVPEWPRAAFSAPLRLCVRFFPKGYWCWLIPPQTNRNVAVHTDVVRQRFDAGFLV